jgi:hypothetical protein
MDLLVRQLAISRLESRQLGQKDRIAKFRSDHQNRISSRRHGLGAGHPGRSAALP